MKKHITLLSGTANRELAEKYEVRVVPTIVFGNYKIEGVPEDKYIVNLLVEASKGG